MKYYQAPTNAHRPDLHRNAAAPISARLLGARPWHCFPLRPARAARLQSPVLGALQTPQGGRAADGPALLPATYPVLRPAAARRTGPGRASNKSRAGAIESRSVGGGSIERHQAHFRALEARLNGAVAQVRLFCCEIVS